MSEEPARPAGAFARGTRRARVHLRRRRPLPPRPARRSSPTRCAGRPRASRRGRGAPRFARSARRLPERTRSRRIAVPENDDAVSASDRMGVGSTVGPYRLVEHIGEGGMGNVYLAERADGLFRHRVAIKVTHSSARGGDAARRFRAERQILASLQHPNIVTLLDGGVTPAGEAYLVMEHVAGVPITRALPDARLAARGAPATGAAGGGRRAVRAPARHRPPRSQARQHPRYARTAPSKCSTSASPSCSRPQLAPTGRSRVRSRDRSRRTTPARNSCVDCRLRPRATSMRSACVTYEIVTGVRPIRDVRQDARRCARDGARDRADTAERDPLGR